MKISYLFFLVAFITFTSCQPTEQSKQETGQENERSEKAERLKRRDLIPTYENERTLTHEGLSPSQMDDKLGQERCAICARYQCIKDGVKYNKGDILNLGNICTGRIWSQGCPRYVHSKDGAEWELLDGCRKC